jgi:hypothetical protein
MTEQAAVLVFNRDGDLMVFLSVHDAAGYMEAVDVEAGEYPAVFLLDGTQVDVATDGQYAVTLTPGDPGHMAELMQHLREYNRVIGRDAVPADDPVAAANAWLDAEWRVRWPQRPAWLRSRVLGDAPPRV